MVIEADVVEEEEGIVVAEEEVEGRGRFTRDFVSSISLSLLAFFISSLFFFFSGGGLLLSLAVSFGASITPGLTHTPFSVRRN